LRNLTYISRLLLVAGALLGAACAAAQAGEPDAPGSPALTPRAPHRVPRVAVGIQVDGVLGEDVWREALVLPLDYEVSPGENVPAVVRTEALLAYNSTHLLVGFTAYDPDPSAIRARVCDRDNLFNDDWVALNLDTFNDQRRSLIFFSNPLGIQAENIEVEGSESCEWDPIWDSSGRITPEGYTVEMAIPFEALRFQRSAGDQTWGVDAIRNYPRSVQHRLALFPRDRSNICYLCQADKIVGFAGATPGRNFELDPTVSASFAQEREGYTAGEFRDSEQRLDPGLTARFGFTPNITLNATVNPDFSQVEADAVQMSVNRQFALDYAERRPFFLEGADVFRTRFNLVRTRSLADPNWGLKVTGKEGANAIGFFAVEDKITNLVFPASQESDETALDAPCLGTVLRYRRDLASAASVGLSLTDRESYDRGVETYYNRVAGLDGFVRLTARDRIQCQVVASQTRYPEWSVVEPCEGADLPSLEQPLGGFSGTALDVLYEHAARGLDWYAVHRTVGEGFRADLGFMPHANFHYSEAGWGYTWHREPDHWWNMLNLGSGLEAEHTSDWRKVARALTFWFDYSGPRQAHLDAWAGLRETAYAGKDFNTSIVHVEAGAWPTGALFTQVEAEVGKEIDYDNVRQGDVLRLEPYLEWMVGRHLVLRLEHFYERLDVPAGQLYTANILQARAVYQFTRRAFLRAIFQDQHYDYAASLYSGEVTPEESYLASQVLFSYKINAQTVFFIGYSDNYYGASSVKTTQTDRTFFTKLGYAWVR
jgi:hypothetical protein